MAFPPSSNYPDPHPENGTENDVSSTRSRFHDAASVARERLHDVVAALRKPETRHGLQHRWDSLVKVMFAPCEGDVGGVAREDLPPGGDSSQVGHGSRDRTSGATHGHVAKPWGASVPF